MLYSCTETKVIERDDYSFFVAGHVYGKPGSEVKNIYEPFKNKFEFIKNQPSLSFGVLTGDIVENGSIKQWNNIENDLKDLPVKVHYALGNHDYRDPDVIKEKFDSTYYYFINENDLHIILDPNLDNWNISGDQLSFFKKALKKNRSVDNIFVYTHQVLWWDPSKEKVQIRINSGEGKAKNINFWDEIMPRLQSTNLPTYMIAGDIGAAVWSDDCSYDVFGNITLISSGMGHGYGDNFLMFYVDTIGSVNIKLISINTEDPYAMGEITNY